VDAHSPIDVESIRPPPKATLDTYGCGERSRGGFAVPEADIPAPADVLRLASAAQSSYSLRIKALRRSLRPAACWAPSPWLARRPSGPLLRDGAPHLPSSGYLSYSSARTRLGSAEPSRRCFPDSSVSGLRGLRGSPTRTVCTWQQRSRLTHLPSTKFRRRAVSGERRAPTFPPGVRCWLDGVRLLDHPRTKVTALQTDPRC
jgi:hypothetical protein